MIVDTLRNAKNTRGLREGIDKALAFLGQAAIAKLAPGRHDIDGDRVYALVQDYTPFDPAGRQFESHRRYIDVQYVHSGREIVYWAPTSRLKNAPYSDQNDAILYDDPLSAATATAVGLEAGSFGIFFPEDAHMPCCRWAGAQPANEPVRKVVVKVLVGP